VSRSGRTAARPVRATLTHDYIIRTALALIDRDGLDALSMRRLGAELGNDPMAVYHYLPNKAALYDGVVEAIYAEMDLDSLSPSGDWRAYLARSARRMRDVLRRHPNALPIIATRPAYSPPILATADRSLRLLQRAGLSPSAGLEVISCLRAFTVGHILAELGDPVGGPTTTTEDAAAAMATYPHLSAAVATGYRPDKQYERGLYALLDGFARQLTPRHARPRGRVIRERADPGAGPNTSA
jgi:TetR/AcrR family tetracycline transcriptional repressor